MTPRQRDTALRAAAAAAREKVGCGLSTHDWMPTCGNRGERHLRGVVGRIFRIDDASLIRIGNCPDTKLKTGDVVHCLRHSGDCFQSFVLLKEVNGAYAERTGPGVRFGAYESFNAMTDLGSATDLMSS